MDRWQRLATPFAMLVVLTLLVSSCGPTAEPAKPAAPAETAKPADAKPAATTAAQAPKPTEPAKPAEQAPAAKPTEGPSSTAAAAAPRSGGTLVIAQQADLETADPQGGVGVAVYPVYALFEPMMDFDEQMQFFPLLATNWEQLDPTHLRVKLRQGVTYHSGNPFNADAVQQSFERFARPGVPGRAYALLRMVKGVQKVNDYEVIVETDGPFTPLKTHLSHIAAVLIDPDQAAKAGAEYGMNPTGTGPFKFTSWQRGNQFVVEKNPNYWQQGKPYLDRVIYRIIPDANARLLAFEKGEVDMALNIPPQEVKRLKNDPNVNLREINITRSVYMGVNYKREPFDNPNVRQALNYAVDKTAIVSAIQEDTVDLASIPYPKHVPGSGEGKVKVYEYDPARAKQMLDETGWMPGPDGIRQKDGKKMEFKLSYPQGTIPNGKETAEVIQQNLQSVGVGVALEALDAPTHFSGLQGREFEGFLAAVAAVNGDVHYIFTNQWTCGGLWNGGSYCNPKVDQLVEEAQRQTDEQQRFAKYIEAQQILAEDSAMVSLFHMKWYIGLKNYVKGVTISPTEHILVTEANLAEGAPRR
jgi:peptide/nickel transport system substrate-binding protein